MKRIKTIALILLVTVFLTIPSNAMNKEDSRCWYLKRNGNLQPVLDKEQEIIYNYNGYYLDKKCNDTAKERKIYLTFDAGYENGNIEKILDVLNEYSVPAAFFVLDNIILKNTDLVTRMADEGHLVCNHTKNHKDLSRCSNEEIIDNLTDLEKLYEEKTGKELSKYFRFPEGKYSEAALECVNNMGYKTIFWSFAYDDWDNSRQPNYKSAINKILSNTHNGAVILLHPTSKTNAKILPILIEKWQNQGYSFGTLDDLTK